MNGVDIVWAAAGAALLFWIVGAYNRLVRLRGRIVREFAPAHEQFRRRHALLLEQTDALGAVLASAAPRVEALRAACEQVFAACARASVRPGAVGAITSLRLADAILVEARARLPVQHVPGVDLAGLNARLTEADALLAFERSRFNDAVRDYNQAVRLFPTVLIVGLFGFRSAATL